MSAAVATHVLVAMSGGVDSGVAAALVAEAGHRVTGVTLKLWCYGQSPLSPRACCTLDAIDDARGVARRMGFAHYVVDAEEVFRERVLQPFLDEYSRGRTPYPCAQCNQHLKFGDLFARLGPLGADVLATGHYARITREPDGSHALRRAADDTKDQSYALARVPYATLPRVIFPLGELDKGVVREHGRRLGLTLWDKPESQDLCFVPDGDYAGFAADRLGQARGFEPGPFVDGQGRKVGEHRGIFRYTVGQRRGLGLAGAEPSYVVAIHPRDNSVEVGPREALAADGLLAASVNWLCVEPPPAGMRVEVQVRSRHVPAPATLEPFEDGSARVRFDVPQSAITPGQLAVFYAGDRVVGGGPIERALPAAA